MKVLVHKISLGDVDDIDVYIAQPIYEWQQTEAGKWVMDHSKDTYWQKGFDVSNYAIRYDIIAELSEQDATFFNLKWGIK